MATPAELKHFYEKVVAMPRWGWLPLQLRNALYESHRDGLVTTAQLRTIGTSLARLAASKDLLTRDFLPKIAALHAKGKREAAIHALLHRTGSEADIEEFVLESPGRRKLLLGLGSAFALGAGIPGIRAVERHFTGQLKPRPVPQVPTVKLRTQLQRLAEWHIAKLREEGKLTDDDHVSLIVHDVDNDRRLVEIEPQTVRMAASAIKPFVMLAAYHKVKEGQAPYEDFETDVRMMFSYSDNYATNRLIDFVGGVGAVDQIVKKYKFKETSVVEKIPDGGKTYLNSTTSADLDRFFEQVQAGKLISPEVSSHMFEQMRNYGHSKLLRAGIKMERTGKTGYVYGANIETGHFAFPGRIRPRAVRFTIMIENQKLPSSDGKTGVKPEWKWGRETSDAMRRVFTAVHEHVTR